MKRILQLHPMIDMQVGLLQNAIEQVGTDRDHISLHEGGFSQ